MVSWKEKGEVPDSDDEDISDTQSTADDDDQLERIEEEVQEKRSPISNGLDNNHGSRNNTGSGGLQEHLEHLGQPGKDSHVEVETNDPSCSPAEELDARTANTLEDVIESHCISRASTPGSPPRFKIPQALAQLDDYLGHDEPDNPPVEPTLTPRSGSEFPTIEEISKSYVRLSSPMSSVLSSPPASQPTGVSINDTDGLQRSLSLQDPLQSGSAVPVAESETLQDTFTVNRRNLRQRKAIQLHPYIVEQQKYRDSLKARGITPMRIVNTQNGNVRRRPDPGTQDVESQEADSQAVDIEMMNSSLTREFDWQSSPPVGRKLSDESGDDSSIHNVDVTMNDDDGDDDDDEFPSIDEIARGLHGESTSLRKKSRMKTYSSKEKRPKPPRIRTQIQQSPHMRRDIFDLPESPPTTSSPYPTSRNKQPRGSTPLSRTISSKEPTPNWLDQDELHPQHPIDMPTPATSASRPVSDAILLDSDTDEDDPFAKEPSAALSDSSDESIEIRKVSKKFRGVLPASHLRLDQQQWLSSASRHQARDSLTLSPAKVAPRRGVALPKAPRVGPSPVVSTSHGIPYLSDEDSEDDDKGELNRLSMEKDTHNRPKDRFGLLDAGSAEEDDRIDAMLPSRKRQKRNSDTPPRKKRRTVSNSMVKKVGGRHSRQPKMTDHISSSRPSCPLKENEQRRHKRNNSRVAFQHAPAAPARWKRPAAPRLGILDVIDTEFENSKRLPRFLRVATRTAKSRKGFGRQSPSQKFIRLDNREDTLIAQSILREWRNGTIHPKDLNNQFLSQARNSPTAQGSSQNKNQRGLQSPARIARPGSRVAQSSKPRQLAVMSRVKQTSISDFVAPRAVHQQSERRHAPPAGAANRRRYERARAEHQASRPAQLESSVAEYNNRHQTSAFRSSKKALDALYRTHRKRHAEQTNVALHRFLADEDAAFHSVQSSPPVEEVGSLAHQPKEGSTAVLKGRPRLRKRQPNRLDASAAIYRQPSEPLIVDYLVSTQPDEGSEGTRLLGLPKFGTSYSTYFDIFPLQSGIYFHETTFLGSGRLLAAIKFPGGLDLKGSRPYASLKLGEKQFRWGPWDENVSSEIGVCFDWLLEQLSIDASSSLDLSTPDIAGVVTSIVDYVQSSLSFTSPQHQGEFISRVSEVLQECSVRIEKFISTDQPRSPIVIDVLVRCTVLLVQVLQLSREMPTHSITSQLQHQLKKLGCISARLLLSLGLEPVRKLYDDLQYLSIRERGIRCDQRIAQAWVILMKVFEAARIPRCSFWDVVNIQLISPEVRSMDDARAMEKIWYSMFSLLPLYEFDISGVIIPGWRHKSSWDNWSLPQKLMQRVFALYISNPKQSPGFNEYCRTIVSRCHYLMLEWGWWKCSGMIGTIFDFFASQKLAHLRNEEVYKSPRFLEELDGDPSLTIDPEDRCFHILLKIIALALKHMCQAEDMKGIRNLVARLLPNHDRQYPKEQAVHHRELASLRNHHDILSTLFWAAPADLRPSIVLIQDLVIADRSHKEACLINLKAWNNLARFVLAHTPTSLLIETYQPLKNWQSTHFTKLLEQYSQAGSELRKQVDLLPQHSRDSISETQLQNTILANQLTTISTIKAYCDSMDAIYRSLPWPSRNSLNLADVTTPANLETFVQLFTVQNSPFETGNAQMNGHGRLFLSRFLERLSKVDPETKPQSVTSSSDELDSQDFGTIDVDAYDFDVQALQPLRNIILPAFQKVVCSALYSNEHEVPRLGTAVHTPLSEMVQTWASLVSLFIRKETLHPSDILLEGPNAVFGERRGVSNKSDQGMIARVHWPLFLGELVKQTKSVFPRVTLRKSNSRDSVTFHMGLEWMLAIARPLENQYYEHTLTAALHAQNFFLLAGLDLCGWSIDEVERTIESPDFNLLCIRLAIDNMSKILSDPAIRSTTHGERSLAQVKEEFTFILKRMMDLMEAELKRLNSLRAVTHTAYVKFVQELAKQIRSRGKDILPLPDFFVHESADFWPDQSDPGYQLANLKAYTVRLTKGEPGAKWETFHYLYNSFKKALLEGDLDPYIQKVTRAARAWPFFEFMIDCMIPTAIIVGFSNDRTRNAIALTLCLAWLPTLGRSHGSYTSYEHYIGNRELGAGEEKAEHTFQSAIKILLLIMDGLRKYFQQHSEVDMNDAFEGVVSIVCQLGDYLLPEIVSYVESQPEKYHPVIDEFRKFMSASRDHLKHRLPAHEYLNIDEMETRSTVDVSGFVKVVEEDMRQWTVMRYLPIGSYHDLRRTGQRVKIPVHGNSKEIDLEDVAKNLWTFNQIIEHASPFTMLENRHRKVGKRAETSSDYGPWIVDELGTTRPNPQRRFLYRDTARMRVLRDMSAF